MAPLFLAFAMTATTASGATFLGLPALAYTAGLPALWYAFVYPLGVYCGVLLCLHAIRRAGESFGSRSIPEYLGDRYDSDALRIIAALFSMLLLFYLAGQLLAGAVMFTSMLGLETFPALCATALILMIYIGMGGAHADILTDGVQGALMLSLAALVLWMFLTGFGIEGGFTGMLEQLEEIDPALTEPLSPTYPLFNSKWDVFAIFVAHLPLGLLPHIGNKLWALKSNRDQTKFITYSFAFGMLLPAIGLGGIMARVILGDSLFAEGMNPNQAIPELFIATMPSWIAALIGAGVLAAVMSTADGLVVSSAQIFANDIYRRTLAPRWGEGKDDKHVDHVALVISRVATVLVLVCAVALAWSTRETNVALLVWIGVGGMMAALSRADVPGGTVAPRYPGRIDHRVHRRRRCLRFTAFGLDKGGMVCRKRARNTSDMARRSGDEPIRLRHPGYFRLHCFHGGRVADDRPTIRRAPGACFRHQLRIYSTNISCSSLTVLIGQVTTDTWV